MKIILLSPIAPEAIRELQAGHDVVLATDTSAEDLPRLLADREAIVLRSGVQITEEVLRAAPEVRLIVRAGSGIDNVDLDAARRRGIRVVRVPPIAAANCAEAVIAASVSAPPASSPTRTSKRTLKALEPKTLPKAASKLRCRAAEMQVLISGSDVARARSVKPT